jgi:hypothetical protein
MDKIDSGSSVLWVYLTGDEGRAERAIQKIVADYKTASGTDLRWNTWNCVAGATWNTKCFDPVKALQEVRDKVAGNAFVLMKDLGAYLNGSGPKNLELRRQLAELVIGNALTNHQRTRPICILANTPTPHPDIAEFCDVIDFDLPRYAEMEVDVVDFILKSVSEDKTHVCTPELKEKITWALLGTTAEEAMRIFAYSITTSGGVSEKVLEVIAAEKAKVIRKIEGLRYIPYAKIPDIDKVGGFKHFITWLKKRARAYTKHAKEVGMEIPRGAVLIGPPGCLAEDTVVNYHRGKRNSGRPLTIAALCDKFNSYKSKKLAGRPWQPNLVVKLQSYDPQTGQVKRNPIRAIWCTGEKQCLRITTATCGSVTLTHDHPMLLANGTFAEAETLAIGTELMVKGNMLAQPGTGRRVHQRRKSVCGVTHHPYANVKNASSGGVILQYKRIAKARLVLEAAMNQLPYAEYLHILKHDAERAKTLQFIAPDLDVHHCNNDALDDRPDNLMALTGEEHDKLHANVAQLHVQYTRQTTVTAIENVGLRKTYDVEMEEPLSNFVVNDGIIVHNCGKTFVAKAAAKVLGLDLILLDIGSLFDNHKLVACT